MRGYYTETIEKDTKYRQDYVEGIQFFYKKRSRRRIDKESHLSILRCIRKRQRCIATG